MLTFRAALVLFAACCFAPASFGDELVVGSAAPDFTLHGSDGNTYALSDFVGNRELVLAWFPKAFTPG